MHRTITRGSHQSQASVSASTRSWVMSNQANPPPPPVKSSVSTSSTKPVRASRPLPQPDPHFRQSRVPVNYGMVNFGPDGEEPQDYAHAEFDQSRNLPFGYSNQTTGRVVPEHVVSPAPSQPTREGGPSTGNRSFVGGFFKGLKRLPKVFKGGNKGEEQRLQRKGTFGTEGTSPTATAMTRGNTLPRYLSNPSIGPSNPQFAHRLSMAVANGSLPPSATIPPAEFQLRNNPAGPQFPLVTVTPPSDGIVEEEHADFYDGPTAEYPGQLDDILEHEPHINGRTATVMIYGTESQAPTITTHTPTPRPTTVPTTRVSYQTELPTRASAQAQTDSQMHAPTPLAPMSPMRTGASIQRAMQSPSSLLSPPTTSRYTMSSVASRYDPSFASDLGPIEKFFKGFYNLPWISPDRVTVDYRPGDSDRARKKVKGGIKKPMASWYRAMLTRSRMSRDLDLLSSGTRSHGTGTVTGNSISQLGSPTSRRSGRTSNHRRTHSGKAKHPRRNRRRVISDATTDTQQPRSASPIIPAPYPYAYPAVYQYPYPYNGYVPVPQTTPRGPRTHHHRRKASKHPTGGYSGYQPMAMPPPQPMPPPPGAPIYFITPSPPQSQTGPPEAGGQGGAQKAQYQPQGPMQISPVIMHYVPGAFNPNPSMLSPPTTPQRHAAQAPS
jgi:hypothetical protein